MDIREFCEHYDIRIDSGTPIGYHKWHQGDTTWELTLINRSVTRGARRMKIKWTHGKGIDFANTYHPDDIEMVMESLQLDAQTAENYDDAHEMADDYDMAWADKKERLAAINIFRGCNSIAEQLKVFLGSKLYKKFLWDVEPD